MPKPPVEAIAQEIAQRFQGAEAVFLAGSVVRGEATSTSDLDMVIVTHQASRAPYRESLILQDWPIELFVHTPTSLLDFFEKDAASRTPSLPQMCHEGLLITAPNAVSEHIRQQATTLLQAGPPPLSETECLQYRYHLSDLLEDLKGSTCPMESAFILHKLLQSGIAVFLAQQQSWSGSGKWLWRALKRSHPLQAQHLAQAFEAPQKSQAIVQWIEEEVLRPLGGPLFDGYVMVAPR